MLQRVLLALTLPALSFQAQAPGVIKIPAITVPSPSLGADQKAAILFPASYPRAKRRYPVLYLLHGGGQNHAAFVGRDWSAALASREIIIVTPSVGDSWYVNSAADPAAKYEDFVIKDLIRYIDATYPTVASREGRAIAGVSMGAWGAMLLGLKHPQLFSAVGAFSAPFGISRHDPNMDMTSKTQQRFGAPGTPERRDRDPVTFAMTMPIDSVPMLYLACGSQDVFVADNRAFVQRLTERKIPYEYREVSPLGHSWDLWDGQVVSFIDILAARWRGLTK